jgi:hypothetical protein
VGESGGGNIAGTAAGAVSTGGESGNTRGGAGGVSDGGGRGGVDEGGRAGSDVGGSGGLVTIADAHRARSLGRVAA